MGHIVVRCGSDTCRLREAKAKADFCSLRVNDNFVKWSNLINMQLNLVLKSMHDVKRFPKSYPNLWDHSSFPLEEHAHRRACRHAFADCWAGPCCLEKLQHGWKLWAVQRVWGYGGPTGPTAEEEMPTNDIAPCSFRQKEEAIREKDPEQTNKGWILLENFYNIKTQTNCSFLCTLLFWLCSVVWNSHK